MKTNFKILVQCLFVAGIMCWSGCSKEIVKYPDTGQISSSGLKSGSTDLIIQTFTLSGGTWSSIASAASSYGSAGFTMAWLPPCSKSADTYGYLPTEWYTYSNNRGTAAQLSSCISALTSAGMSVIADVVVNHRCGSATSGSDFTNPAFTCNSCAVVSNDKFERDKCF
jgi:alpha-amylase